MSQLKPRVTIINHYTRDIDPTDASEEFVKLGTQLSFMAKEVQSRGRNRSVITRGELDKVRQAVKLLEAVAY